jgi:hypothetical protein
MPYPHRFFLFVRASMLQHLVLTITLSLAAPYPFHGNTVEILKQINVNN